MKAIGIEKAVRRLNEAKKHLDRLQDLSRGVDVHAFEYEWFLLVSALNSVQEILKTTASKNPTSRQWFSSVEKHVIRQDPLLRFLLHARGCDHHGLATATTLRATEVIYESPITNPVLSFTIQSGDGKLHKVKPPDPARIYKFAYQLTSVIDDRYGTIYAPPSEHLGETLPATDPITVAAIGIKYHASLLDEAVTLIKS